jgi:hypothetical protein
MMLTNARAFDRKSEVVAVTMRLYRLAAMMLVIEAETAASRLRFIGKGPSRSVRFPVLSS